jgi:hypothetical protein
MELLQAQVILQSLTAASILGGLIYTAVQFRNWQRAQHVANFTKLVEMQMQLRRMRIDDPSLAAVYTHDVEGFGSEREVREYFMNLIQLSLFEIAWFSHRLGQIPDAYFESWAGRMREIAREPSFQRMLDRPTTKIMDSDFERYVLANIRPRA